MYESLGLTLLKPMGASVVLGMLLGFAFGALGLYSGFCMRRALVGPPADRKAAAAVWLVALATAVAGVQAAIAAGMIGFDGHRFVTGRLPLAAILTGGALFGAGMVLTRGCGARLSVLAGAGNLRAALVLVVFAITAMATLRGVLAPVRLSLAQMTVSLPSGGLPGPAVAWVGLTVAVAAAAVWRSRPGAGMVLAGATIGLLVPLGWVGTGLVLADDFDPIPMESLSFTGPLADALFWTVAASAIPAGFGTGLIGGTLVGSLGLALVTRRFAWESFASPGQTGRYVAGGMLMGFGGVLAGGCTVGAGLAGIPTLGIAALLALAAIVAGALAAQAALSRASYGSDAPQATPAARRAE